MAWRSVTFGARLSPTHRAPRIGSALTSSLLGREVVPAPTLELLGAVGVARARRVALGVESIMGEQAPGVATNVALRTIAARQEAAACQPTVDRS